MYGRMTGQVTCIIAQFLNKVFKFGKTRWSKQQSSLNFHLVIDFINILGSLARRGLC